MKDYLKRLLKIICIELIITVVQPFNVNRVYAEENKNNITILFTHDMHDHFLPVKVKKKDEILELGGYAQLKNAIDLERSKVTNSILIDGGDFSMGTLFQSIYKSDSPQLKILGKMGYDVTTFGNHEFDFKANGLSECLNSALKYGDKLPEIVQANMSFPKDKNGELTPSLSKLQQTFKNYGVKEYTILNRNGIKVGVFGLMGEDSASNAPMAEVEFIDSIKNAKRIVNILKEKERVDLIVCVSHSGIDKNKSKSEDETLAKQVPEIDVIISGHTHTKLDKPIQIGNTIIGSCGEYGENLGVMKISKDEKKRWKIENYKLKQINSSLGENVEIHDMIKSFKSSVQEKYLNNFGMKFDEVLGKTSFSFKPLSEIGIRQEEEPLGDFISDAYIYAVEKAEGENYEPIDVAIVPSGTIRGSFVKGNITVSDVFNISSLGVGKDGVSGYPLTSAYLTGKELKTLCEVDASVSPIMNGAQLYMSGISYAFNPNRMIFNKVTNAVLQKKDGTYEKIQDKKLYRVVAGLYSTQMLSTVSKKSFGLLKIVPKTKDGLPITDFQNQIITEKVNGKNNEVKEWVSIANYIKSFSKIDGVPEIPYEYSKVQGRKIVDTNENFFSLISRPNHIALVIYSIIAAVGMFIVFVILKIIELKSKS